MNPPKGEHLRLQIADFRFKIEGCLMHIGCLSQTGMKLQFQLGVFLTRSWAISNPQSPFRLVHP